MLSRENNGVRKKHQFSESAKLNKMIEYPLYYHGI